MTLPGTGTQEKDLVKLERLVQKVKEVKYKQFLKTKTQNIYVFQNSEERKNKRDKRAMSLAQKGEEASVEILPKTEEKVRQVII